MRTAGRDKDPALSFPMAALRVSRSPAPHNRY
jgi:hypothetical protein